MTQSVSQLFDPIDTQPVVEPPSAKELGRLAAQYLLLEKEHEVASGALKDVTQRKDQAEMQLLDALAQSGMKSFKLETGHLLSSCSKFRYSLPPKSMVEDREKAMRWLKRVGAKDLIAEDLNPQTMSKFLRERNEQGKEISPLIKAYEQRYLSVRKE